MNRNLPTDPRRAGITHSVPHAALLGAAIAFHKSPVPRNPGPSTVGTRTKPDLRTSSVGDGERPPLNSSLSAESRTTVISVTTSSINAPSRQSSESSTAEADTDTPRAARRMADRKTDVESIPPTKSLISKFEHEHGTASQNSALAGRLDQRVVASKPQVAAGPSPPVVSPKPQRMISTKSISQIADGKTVYEEPEPINAATVAGAFNRSSAMVQQRGMSTPVKPALPPPRRIAKPAPGDSLKGVLDEATKTRRRTHSLDEPPALHPFATGLRTASPSGSVPPLSRSPNPHSYKQKSLMATAPHMSAQTLANAMVGASLASRSQPPSRHTSPSNRKSTSTNHQTLLRNAPRLPSPRRRTLNQIGHHLRKARSASPTKRPPGSGMLMSLRNNPNEEDSDSSGERGRLDKLARKHPHKHHEGTRKRWRDTIDAEERKRYEGVWAVNRALWIPRNEMAAQQQDEVENDVLDLVVRDIWSRSGLAEHTLAEIWDLVDRRRINRLSREEFVVGLWLVDQRLKGRKLPAKVAESVWGSVTGLGVKVRIKS